MCHKLIVVFSLKNKCSLSHPDSKQLPLSRDDIECSSCLPGQFLHFNFNTGKTECLSCPENTYSTGGVFRINGQYREWTNEKLFGQFDNECYIIKEEIENENCKAFTLSKDASYIVSNNGFNDNNYQYVAMISLQINLVTKGQIKFKYKKDTTIQNNYRVGLMRFFVNYLTYYEDYNERNNNEWKEVSFNLEKGRYSFLWQYLKTVSNTKTQEMKMEISDIEITGVETASIQCTECAAGISPKGSDYCRFCVEGEFFDNATQKCEKCPKGTTSDYNSVGKENCKVIPQCTEKNYYKIISPKCNISTKKAKFQLELITENCVENLKNKEGEMECIKCQPGQYVRKSEDGNYSRCEYCPQGYFTSEENASECKPCEGITSNMYYVTPLNPLSYKSQFEIINIEGEVKINYHLINDNIQNPKIYIEVDGIPISSYSLTKTEINIPASVGQHHIEIISENAVLETITFTNASIGGSSVCKACSSGYLVRENGKYVCQNCGNGMELNEENECELCRDNFFKRSNQHLDKCIKCPPMTISNSKRNNCIPYDVTANHKYMLKYIISNYKKNKEILCNLTGGLCAQNFYGPIRDIANKNLFYLSYNEPNLFNTTDYTYKYKHSIESSFIIKLQNSKEINNTKEVISLGKEISYIKLLNSQKNKGVIIKYTNGDTCESDPTQRYETILLLNCTKSQNEFSIIHAPTFVTQSPNKCKYYFSWSSTAGCPICLLSQASKLKLSCNNFNRNIYYNEGPSCIIDSTDFLSTNDFSEDENNIVTSDIDSIVDVYQLQLDTEMPLPGEMEEYVENKKETEVCYMYDDFDKEILYIVIIIPICYIAIVILCVYFWCKYRRISGDYHRLMEEPMNTNPDVGGPNVSADNHNQQIEMGSVQNSKNEERLDKEHEVKIDS